LIRIREASTAAQPYRHLKAQVAAGDETHREAHEAMRAYATTNV
jgi:hypothetical protein